MGMATGESMSTLEPISTECEPSFSILFMCVGRFSAPNVVRHRHGGPEYAHRHRSSPQAAAAHPPRVLYMQVMLYLFLYF